MSQELEFNPEAIVSEAKEAPDVPQVEDEKLDLFKDNLFEKENENPEELDELEDNEDAPNPDDNENNDPSSKAVFSVVLGQDLMDRGILSEFNSEEVKKIAEEQGEAEAIARLFEIQAEATSNEIKSGYDSSYQEYLNLTSKGVSKGEASGIQQLESFEKSLSDINLSGESDAEVQSRKDLLVLNYRLTTKWTEDKIQKYVEKMYDEGSDLDEVDEAKSNLSSYIAEEKENAIASAKLTQDKIEEDRLKIESDYKSYVKNTNEYIKGEKVTEKTKQDIEKLIFTPVKLPNGQVTNQLWAGRSKNPTAWDAKVAYLHSIGYFEDEPLDKFQKSAKTKATAELENFLTNNAGRDFMKSGGKSFSKNSANTVDFLDF